MDSARFRDIAREVSAVADEALDTKGIDYPTRDGDRLSNFEDTAKVVSLLLGREVTTSEVMLVFFAKHLIPLLRFAEGRYKGPIPLRKAGDAINYVKFLYAHGLERAINPVPPFIESEPFDLTPEQMEQNARNYEAKTNAFMGRKRLSDDYRPEVP